MGSPKALLRIGGMTFLERILTSIRTAGIEDFSIVVGHHRNEIAAAFPSLPLVFNPDYNQGMSTSVKAGIRSLSPSVTGAAVFLVDHPLIEAATIATLASHLRAGRVVLPVYDGRRGHPVFIAADLFPEIVALSPDEGLNVVVRRDPARVLEVPVIDRAVLQDIDTPQQFQNLLSENE